jgi:hypothetical protein
MYAYVDEQELPKQLADGDIKEVPKRLVDNANKGGGHDNITAVVVRISEGGGTGARTSEISLKLEVLKGMQMFRYLSYKELVQVAAVAEMLECKKDHKLFEAGEPGEAMYIVTAGSVKLVMGDKTVAELGRGQHFGEMALVERSTRSLSAIATADGTRLVVIHRKDFYDMIKREPGSAVKMLWAFVQVLGQRLRKTTADLSDALHGDRKGEATEKENQSQE